MCNPVLDFQIKKGKMLDVVRHYKRLVAHQAWIILLKMKNAFKVHLRITLEAGVNREDSDRQRGTAARPKSSACMYGYGCVLTRTLTLARGWLRSPLAPHIHPCATFSGITKRKTNITWEGYFSFVQPAGTLEQQSISHNFNYNPLKLKLLFSLIQCQLIN